MLFSKFVSTSIIIAVNLYYFLFKRFCLLIFKERGRERERETSMCGCLSYTCTGDLAHNPGLCPDRELNQQPFVLQASAQSTEPHQPRLLLPFLYLSSAFHFGWWEVADPLIVVVLCTISLLSLTFQDLFIFGFLQLYFYMYMCFTCIDFPLGDLLIFLNLLIMPFIIWRKFWVIIFLK